ncbi:hypothetical protein Pint_00936 [Pistacia integerrima]|uniref:Uncharacterized protein n=1 Tax=Pistacia integerrima TaxID=434235 RepID=A0ACC0ZFQ5_9ROSI|nr:hypothetical protein Pint_00936 [Pistacia integerrima]
MTEEINKSSHGKKNKSQRLGLTVGAGDGIGGIVLLGGGLAVAGLIAAFSIIKNRNGKKCDNSATPSNKKKDATQGLDLFLQTPSTPLHQNQNSCITSHETSKVAVTVSQIDSPETVLALGDQAVPILDGEKEKPSNFHPENFSNISAEVSSLPAPDGPSLAKTENMIKNESGGDLHLKETIEVKKGDDEVETENLAVEKNLPIQLAEEEEDDDDGGGSSDEDVTEEEVESLEEESSLAEHSPIQSVEEEEKEDGVGDRGKECLMVKEGESSEGEWSVEDEVKKEDEWGEMGKLAVEENSPTQSVEEEEADDSSEEHNIEREEESSEGKLSVEENAAMESAEKEKEDGHDNNDEDSGEEYVMEKEEESSEGTVCSSIESNVQAIWPAEMIEALSEELKGLNAINQKKANETEKYHFLDCKRKRNIKIEDESNNETTENAATVFHKKAAQAVVMMKDLTVNDLNRRIWVWSILVLLLLLLLLHIHRTAVPANLTYDEPVTVP